MTRGFYVFVTCAAVTSPYRFFDWDIIGRVLVLAGSPEGTGRTGRRVGGRDRDDLFSVTTLKHHSYVANSDFHKAKHLCSWKTLVRSAKTWPAVKRALTSKVDVAITLFRKDSC